MASDRERELVVDILRDASTRGQLSVTEFDQRWEYLQAARTVGELVPLVSDLPNVPPPAERPVGRRRRMVDPPPDPVTFRTPGNGPPPAPRPDPPEIPGTTMLPFEDQAWADTDDGRRPYEAGGRQGRRRSPGEFPTESGGRPEDPALDSARNPATRSTTTATEQHQPPRSEASPPPQAGSAPQVSAAEEWNTSLRACVGSFALLIVGLLLALVFG